MFRIVSFLSLLVVTNLCQGQGYYARYKNLDPAKDTTAIRLLITEWEKTNPNDPELYPNAFNFYFNNSRKELISLEKDSKGDKSLAITDKKGKEVGFINSGWQYNPAQLEKALGYANTGIAKFPSRLDIRFGKCYVLGELKEYDSFSNEIIKTIDYSNTIKNNWLWTENAKVDSGENFLLKGVYDYMVQLYDTEDDALLKNMQQIGDAAAKYYTGSIEILSLTGVSNVLAGNYDKAIRYFNLAEKINPQDVVVLNNLAEAYKRKGDKANAVKYLQLVMKYGDKDDKQHALDTMKKLEKE